MPQEEINKAKKNSESGENNGAENGQAAMRAPTASERFALTVKRQFEAEAGSSPAFTDYEMALAQHLFLKIDSTLLDLEAKRRDQGRPPITWANVNMRKLALDAVHRVNLGLDALIAGHIYPIPYLIERTKLYDVDLRIGYVGKDFYRRENALDKPENITYELVYSTDKFRAIKKDARNGVEGYEFEITNPFDRGEVVGGFGYIEYWRDMEYMNKLVIVTKEDFDKSKGLSKAGDFWQKFPVEMMYKTLVNRVTDKLQLDPRSVNAASYHYVETQDAEAAPDRLIEANAGKTVIDADFVCGPEPKPAQPEGAPPAPPAPPPPPAPADQPPPAQATMFPDQPPPPTGRRF